MPAQTAPDAVGRDAQTSPALASELRRDPARTEAGMREREGEDALLEVRAELVGHPRPASLSDSERFQAPAIDPPLPAVVGRVVHAHRSTGRSDADLACERKEAQAEAEEDVIMRHRAHLAWVWRLRDEAERTSGRRPRGGGGVRSSKGDRAPARCRENSESVQSRFRSRHRLERDSYDLRPADSNRGSQPRSEAGVYRLLETERRRRHSSSRPGRPPFGGAEG